jgi:hypothetical protein
MAKKKTRRIYQGEDGRWRLETTYTTGNVYATICSSKESAERLLYLSETYTRRYVEYTHNGELITAKVTNTGILEHNDGTAEDTLCIRINSGAYWVPAAKCKLMEESA